MEKDLPFRVSRSKTTNQEVMGHAKAIDLVYDIWARNSEVTKEDLFLLHKAVQTAVVLDYYHPLGEWKREPNGIYARDPEGRQIFIEFARPDDVPDLMREWLNLLNGYFVHGNLSVTNALDAYTQLHVAFVRVHPFFDGNGRLARLLANLPVLKPGSRRS